MRALEVLDGVGDESLGQWEERGERAWHIRRRLSAEEEVTIGPACDIRKSREGQERLTRAWPWLPENLRSMAREEIAGL